MTDQENITTDVIDEVTVEVSEDVIVDTKRDAKLVQLANARVSAKTKKRQRDDDMSSMKDQLDSLTTMLLQKNETEQKAEEAEPIVKRQRVTAEPVGVPDVIEEDTWVTSVIRTSAVLSLGAASWYMQHRYAKPPTVAPTEKKKESKTATTAPTVLHPAAVPRVRPSVGKSGFVV
jgi:G3E family GTPase